ncbi:MAG TPA: AAA family ATPase [Isosphaeraceae bacterium]|jgi:uncharacterized protein YhaN|nr:AAA family ATPase [Isosphaeraceae bacterium]
MKILRLDLEAFGPFQGKTLELSAGKEGLHLIVGPNEAGKSSALRALKALLFGIDERTTDDFLHKYDRLRLGATVRDGDGSTLAFVRRKGRKNTLRRADDTPIETAELDRFLGGLDASTFSTMFGIDHAGLVAGGQEVLEGKGDLGEALFAASSGMTGLRDVETSLRSELEALFKPRGQNQEINKLIKEIDDLRERMKGLQLSSDEWSRQDEGLRSAEQAKSDLEEQLRQRRKEQGRLVRIRGALPHVARRDELRAELAKLASVVPLSADFGERFRAAEQDRARHQGLRDVAHKELAALVAQLNAIAVPTAVLAESETIEHLHQKLGAHRKAQDDLPGVVAMQKSDEHEARDLLEQLGQPRDLQAAGKLRLRVDETKAIRELGRSLISSDTEIKSARSNLARLERQIEELKRTRADCGSLVDVEPLRRAVKQARNQGDLEKTLAEAEAELARLDRQADQELAKLPGWSGSREALQRLSAPLAATIASAEAELKSLHDRRQRIQIERERTEAKVRELEARLRALDLAENVPTVDDLARGRARRGEGWRLVRQAWLEGASGEAEPGFVGEFAPGRSLADAFEQSLAQTDDLADRLRREATRVAQKAEYLAESAGLKQEVASHTTAQAELSATIEAFRTGWNQQLHAQGLPALDPAELRGWLQIRDAVLQHDLAATNQRLARDRIAQEVASHQGRLVEALGPLDAGSITPPCSFTALIDRAEAFVERTDDRRKQVEAIDKNLDEARRQSAEQQSQLAELEADRQTQIETWTRLMERIGRDATATPQQADEYLEKIDALNNHMNNIKGFQARVDGIHRDAEQLSGEVQAACQRVAPELVEQPLERAVKQLHQALQDARVLKQKQETLLIRRAAEEAKQREAEEAVADALTRLEQLCREARRDDPDQLHPAQLDDLKRKQTEAELRHCEETLRDQAAGLTVDAFVQDARTIDPDELGLKIESIDTEVVALDAHRSTLDQTIGEHRNWLKSHQGSAEAANLAAEIQCRIAELRAKVDDYAALQFALDVLRRGVERFRQAHQDPLLQSASRYFAELTADSFCRLQIDEDDQGKPALRGVRPTGEELGVEQMSDGSCDQLYLALRLASVESWIEHHEPVPFIADDILLKFDDARAVAALKALARLSAHTQVIFFTHHEHLRRLAETHLSADVCFCHCLDRQGR